MCGIVGIFAHDGPPPHGMLWPDLVNHLRHRGPDEGAWWADGPFFLGHRRLSIIDLVSGAQPMATEDGGLVVTFNGEIYNYIELRRELEARGCRFRTASDTEVLLHGYREWGVDLPAHLIGMFAFALADRREQTLFLARDRFGEKPLFLLQAPEYLAFSSELRPLAALPDWDRALDWEALGGYLSLNYVPGARTLFRHVRRLPPASWLRISRQGEQAGAYWSPPRQVDECAGGSVPEALEAWRERFDRAVRLCLRSDVPVGIFLSGGIDSSLVAESAVRQGRLDRAYCLDFAESSYSEYPAAADVAQRLGLPLERVVLTSDAMGRWAEMVEHADDPLADSSVFSVWAIAAAASQRNKVVLGGDGGDELFGGYLTYRATALHRRWISGWPLWARRLLARGAGLVPATEGKVSLTFKLQRFLRAAHLSSGEAHLTWNGTWMPEEIPRLVMPESVSVKARPALQNLVAKHGLLQNCDLLDLQRLDIQEYLPNDILAKCDRMTMAHGLELRAPMLDFQLADWALSLPEALKTRDGGQTKVLLRAAAERTFGRRIAQRPKQGFSIPIHSWIRHHFADQIRDLLSDASVRRLGFLNPTYVQKAVEDHFGRRRSLGFELWGLAVLVAWHRVRVEQRLRPPAATPLIRRQFPTPDPGAG